MTSLKEIIDNLGKQAKEQNKPVSKILKIKGIKRIVIQVNAVPNGNSVRYSMTIHSQNNFKKQIGITANDAGDLRLIADFLDKHADLLNEYVKFTGSGNSAPQVEELELEGEEQSQKSSQSQKKSQKKNVEDEF